MKGRKEIKKDNKEAKEEEREASKEGSQIRIPKKEGSQGR